MIETRIKGGVAVGRAAGVIYASIDQIFPIVARFASGSQSWEEAKFRLEAVINTGFSMLVVREVVVDVSPLYNPPELREDGRIDVFVSVRPGLTPEWDGGHFRLGHVREGERSFLEVEFRGFNV